MRGCTMPTAVVSAALAALVCCTALPLASAQAFAASSAGAGGAQAAATAGLPVPVVPAPVPSPPPCATTATRSPWGQTALLFGTPPGLLAPGDRNYSDVTLCCGGTLDFSWTQVHGIWQLATRTCPASFVNNPAAGQRQLGAVTPSGSQTLRFATPGTYYITSQAGNDCVSGMLFAVDVVGPCAGAPAAPNSQASASGPPGGTSTSTAPGSAAAASGPPGTSFTSTAPGQSYSSAGGRRKLKIAGISIF